MKTWLQEVERRIAISEGCETVRYLDSVGVPTIGIGFNLQRDDARLALVQAGVPESQVQLVIDGEQALTLGQVDALFTYSFAPIESDARASLAMGVFNALTDARRFVICDLVFNMGATGWGRFVHTRAMIALAQSAKEKDAPNAHDLFVEAANDLRASEWFGQVGERAKRDCAMIQAGVWCDPYSDGSDIL